MSNERIILAKPGEKITVRPDPATGGSVDHSSTNRAHTQGAVYMAGTWVEPVPPPGPPTSVTIIDGTGKDVALQQGLLTVRSGSIGMLGTLIRKSTGGALELAGSDIDISDVELAHNVQQGWHGTAPRAILTRVRCHHNNLRSEWGTYQPPSHRADDNHSEAVPGLYVVDPYWEAGGSKIAGCTGVVIQDGWVYENGGPGIWFDISGDDVKILRNRVWNNYLSGIMFEISKGALIQGNLLWANALKDSLRKWGWWSNILISSSSDVLMTGNIVADGMVGTSVIAQSRNEGSYDGHPKNIVIDGDRFLGTGTRIGFYDDRATKTLFSEPSNRIVNCLFDPAEPKPVEWNGQRLTIAQIQAHPHMGPSNRAMTAAEVANARAQLVAA